MPELTRLRRTLRDLSESPACDLQALLDTIDQFYESLAITERDLSNYNSLTEEAIQSDLDTHSLEILKTIIPYIEVRPILEALLHEHTFEYIEAMLTLIKQESENRMQEAYEIDNSLGDLDDHPF
jgi:hypothetical protein